MHAAEDLEAHKPAGDGSLAGLVPQHFHIEGILEASEYDDDSRPKRTGTVWTASAHIITAVIGSGVLSLAWSMAQLGWIAGTIVLLAFAAVTYYTSLLLTDCYRSPDPVKGRRNYTYMDAVRANLGGAQIMICGLTQYTNLLGTSIGYTITASISMVAIKRSNCFHKDGHKAPCHTSNNPYMIIFGAIEIILSQIPNFDKLWWLSIVAALMSFSYSTIGLGLGLAKFAETGHWKGSVYGMTGITRARKIWSIFQALGNVAFAFSYSMILIEIEDTLRSPPPENNTMKKATLSGICTTTLFYFLCGFFGYAAFGNDAPGNLLTGFGFYNPYWLIDIANICIIIHLIGAYQVFAQPIFAVVEKWTQKKYPRNKIITKEYKLHMPACGYLSFNIFRLVWRTLFVIVTVVVSMLLPFFNDVLGILGAVGFWPLTVYFPVEMYIAQNNIKRWTRKWILLQLLSLASLLVSLVALLGSMEGVLTDLKTYKPFKTQY